MTEKKCPPLLTLVLLAFLAAPAASQPKGGAEGVGSVPWLTSLKQVEKLAQAKHTNPCARADKAKLMQELWYDCAEVKYPSSIGREPFNLELLFTDGELVHGVARRGQEPTEVIARSCRNLLETMQQSHGPYDKDSSPETGATYAPELGLAIATYVWKTKQSVVNLFCHHDLAKGNGLVTLRFNYRPFYEAREAQKGKTGKVPWRD